MSIQKNFIFFLSSIEQRWSIQRVHLMATMHEFRFLSNCFGSCGPWKKYIAGLDGAEKDVLPTTVSGLLWEIHLAASPVGSRTREPILIDSESPIWRKSGAFHLLSTHGHPLPQFLTSWSAVAATPTRSKPPTSRRTYKEWAAMPFALSTILKLWFLKKT